MTKKIVSLVLALALMSSVFVGCANKASTESGTKSTTASNKAAAAKTLTVCIGPEPQSIDPALNTAVDGATLIIHTFEGLTKLDDKGKVVNAQAKEITVSKDLLTYTVKLRDDIKWSDGKAVTASDFVYSWQRAIDPKIASEYAYMYDVIVNATDIAAGKNKDLTSLGVKAIDEKTLEIKLAAPCAYFPELLAFPTYAPVRKDVVDGKESWTQDPKTYIGNGPYMLQNWSHKESMTYVKNPNYYDKDTITNDTLKFILLEDDTAILAAYQNNDIAFADTFPLDELDAWKTKPDYHNEAQLGTYFICFNTKKAPFDNPKVRKALSLAIDRNYLVEKISKAGETPADAMVSTGVSDEDTAKQFRAVGGSYYSTKAADYEKNVAEAKKLLAEAGYPEGKGFPAFEYLLNAGNTLHQGVSEALQNMWKTELGINASISAQEWAVFIDTRHKGNFSVARHGWLADYNDPVSFLDLWVTGAGNNDAKWSNAEYDKLIKEVKATDDNKVRMADMHKAENILMEDMPLAPLFFYTDLYLINPNIKGFYTSPLGYKYFMHATAE